MAIMFGILGFAVALIAVPSVEDLVQSAYKVGFPQEGIATVSVVCGFYNCLLFIGEFLGPFLAGHFWEKYHKISQIRLIDITHESQNHGHDISKNESHYVSTLADEYTVAWTYTAFGLLMLILTGICLILYSLDFVIFHWYKIQVTWENLCQKSKQGKNYTPINDNFNKIMTQKSKDMRESSGVGGRRSRGNSLVMGPQSFTFSCSFKKN